LFPPEVEKQLQNYAVKIFRAGCHWNATPPVSDAHVIGMTAYRELTGKEDDGRGEFLRALEVSPLAAHS
jgi:hypothetical protein